MSKALTATRRAGVLLHPTSLPGEGADGTLGPEAYHFVDFLAAGGFTVWQTLPLGPTHEDRSPYLSTSVNAGSIELISRQWLVNHGWLVDSAPSERRAMLHATWQQFQHRQHEQQHTAFQKFCDAQAGWLNDYALYAVIREKYQHKPWFEWTELLRNREPRALKAFEERHVAEIRQVKFEQFLFDMQWSALRHYANQRGIKMFGDMPIFVAHDSVDVWAHRNYFKMDEQAELSVVAGVPPDYFSATGQRWGNPLYDWNAMHNDDFAWWQKRLARQLAMFDIVRIDHFRGFEACWEIPASEEYATAGHWVKAPGKELFSSLQKKFADLPLVAEDLGLITEEVHQLRQQFDMPGMKILQFGFDGSPNNPYLVHQHELDSVVYTGTHDNDTTVGWYRSLGEGSRHYVDEYLKSDEPMPWALIRAAMRSVACLAIVPMQDLLELGTEARMNVPGLKEDNWHWRFDWQQVPDSLAGKMKNLIGLYGRHPE